MTILIELSDDDTEWCIIDKEEVPTNDRTCITSASTQSIGK